MPEAARERPAIPPAGTALAPEPRFASAAGPFTERESLKRYVTVSVTIVNVTVTSHLGDGCPGGQPTVSAIASAWSERQPAP